MNHIIFEQYSIECRKFLGLRWFWFTSLFDWSKKNSQHFLCQSDANHDLVTRIFPRFLVGFTLSSHWLLKVLSFLLISWCDYFGFDFTILNQKALYTKAETIQDFLEPLCTNLTQRYTYGITISCTLFMVCLPTMMITSCWASSIRQPLGAH